MHFIILKAVKKIYQNLNKVFNYVAMYWAPIPTYPGGGWTFCFCSHEPITHKLQPQPF